MNIFSMQRTLRPLLQPAGKAYGALMQMRRTCYARHIFTSYAPCVPCIAVGNISWGGTGKTPVVDWLLTWAAHLGLRAAVLTRGYKSAEKKEPLLVTPSTPPHLAGDEPLQLALAHPTAAVYVFPQRKVAAALAEQTIKPDLFILDDAMQHLSVQRHSNLVLLHPRDIQEEWNNVIPAGSWREGKSALASASAFAMKIPHRDFEEKKDRIIEKLSDFNVPFFAFSLVPTGIPSLAAYAMQLPGDTGNTASLAQPQSTTAPIPQAAPGRPYVLVSGVGEPEQVAATASLFMERAPEQHMTFSDHHTYTPHDCAGFFQPNLPVLCTAKDAAKLLHVLPAFQWTAVYVLETSLSCTASLFTHLTFSGWWEETWRHLAHTYTRPAAS